jgi:hypothetical protein
MAKKLNAFETIYGFPESLAPVELFPGRQRTTTMVGSLDDSQARFVSLRRSRFKIFKPVDTYSLSCDYILKKYPRRIILYKKNGRKQGAPICMAVKGALSYTLYVRDPLLAGDKGTTYQDIIFYPWFYMTDIMDTQPLRQLSVWNGAMYEPFCKFHPNPRRPSGSPLRKPTKNDLQARGGEIYALFSKQGPEWQLLVAPRVDLPCMLVITACLDEMATAFGFMEAMNFL